MHFTVKENEKFCITSQFSCFYLANGVIDHKQNKLNLLQIPHSKSNCKATIYMCVYAIIVQTSVPNVVVVSKISPQQNLYRTLRDHYIGSYQPNIPYIHIYLNIVYIGIHQQLITLINLAIRPRNS